MDSLSESTVKAVARKLRHYIDIERREEGFDRSGPLDPLGHFSSAKGGTFYYNSLQDKHLQHYFRQPLVRRHLETVGLFPPGAFEDRHKKAKPRPRSRSVGQTTGDDASRLLGTTAKLLLANNPGGSVSRTKVTGGKKHSRGSSSRASYSSQFTGSEPELEQHSVSSISGSPLPLQDQSCPQDSTRKSPSEQPQVQSATPASKSGRRGGSLSPSSVGEAEGTQTARADQQDYPDHGVATSSSELNRSKPEQSHAAEKQQQRRSTDQFQSHSYPALPQRVAKLSLPPHSTQVPGAATSVQCFQPILTSMPYPTVAGTYTTSPPPPPAMSRPMAPSSTPLDLHSLAYPPPNLQAPPHQQYPQVPLAHPPPHLLAQSVPSFLGYGVGVPGVPHPQSQTSPARATLLVSQKLEDKEMQTEVHSGRRPVMVESVGVSTTSSCDASTQTLVHTETQTEESTLLMLYAEQLRKKKLKKQSEKALSSSKSALLDPSLPPSGGETASVSGHKSQVQEKAASTSKTEVTSITHKEIVHTYIHEVAHTGNVEKMKELLTKNESLVDSKNEEGLTPLHVACVAGKSEIIQILSSSGADLHAETPTGYTAIHYAAMHGHVHCLKMLSAMNCRINSQTVDGQTPLHLAAMSGNVECCKWLVANRATVDAVDSNGRTPCDLAKECNNEEVVQLLTKCSAGLKQSDSSIALIATHTRKSSKITIPEDQSVEPSAELLSTNPVLEEEWFSDAEKQTPSQYAAQQQQMRAQEEQESQQQMYREIQEELKNNSSTFLDLAREEVENENFQ